MNVVKTKAFVFRFKEEEKEVSLITFLCNVKS